MKSNEEILMLFSSSRYLRPFETFAQNIPLWSDKASTFFLLEKGVCPGKQCALRALFESAATFFAYVSHSIEKKDRKSCRSVKNWSI